MDDRTANKNLCRQLQDIIVKSDELKTSLYFLTDFEEFVSYSEEMKRFIIANVSNAKVGEVVNDIPKLSLKKYWVIYYFLRGKGSDALRVKELQKAVARDIDLLKEKYLLIYNELCGVVSTS